MYFFILDFRDFRSVPMAKSNHYTSVHLSMLISIHEALWLSW